MNKTKPTLTQQTYEKVCALETMLKAHLESKPPPFWRPPRPAGRWPSSGWRTRPTTCPASTRPTCSTASPACPS